MAPPTTLSACCTTGHLHQGKPIGNYRMIDNIRTYYTDPAAGSKGSGRDNVVVLLSDALGLGFPNTLLLADNFAANGYMTVVPDLFGGEPVPYNYPVGYDTAAWLTRHGPDHVIPIVHRVVAELRVTVGSRFIAGVGYCFGARYVLRCLRRDLFDVGYIAHPNGPLIADEVLDIRRPLCVVLAENDGTFDRQRQCDLEQQLTNIKIPHQVTIYSGVKHGFALRCDEHNAVERFAMEQAFNQAIQWINHHLTEGLKYVSNT